MSLNGAGESAASTLADRILHIFANWCTYKYWNSIVSNIAMLISTNPRDRQRFCNASTCFLCLHKFNPDEGSLHHNC